MRFLGSKYAKNAFAAGPHWGSLQRSPRPPSWIWGATLRWGGNEWRGGERPLKLGIPGSFFTQVRPCSAGSTHCPDRRKIWHRGAYHKSKSDHPQQKKMTSCRFSRWRISAILNFRYPVMGSLKSPRTTSYGSSIETITLNSLVFLENRIFCILVTDRRTDEWSCSRCHENIHAYVLQCCLTVILLCS